LTVFFHVSRTLNFHHPNLWKFKKNLKKFVTKFIKNIQIFG
jgi:hypothetical protein